MLFNGRYYNMPHTSDIDYTQLFRSFPAQYLVFRVNDPDFTLVEASDVVFGWSDDVREAAIGKPYREAFAKPSNEHFQDAIDGALLNSFRKVIKTRTPDEMEHFRYDVVGRDGKNIERYWQATNNPILDKKGRVAYISQLIIDVTDEIEADQETLHIQQQLDEALSIGSIGTWVWDVQRDRLFADKNLAAIFGVPAEDAAKGVPLKTFTDSIYSDDQERVLALVDDAIKNTGKYEAEYRTVSADGIVRWITAKGRVEYDESHTPIQFPGVMFDITDRKTAELNLRLLVDASRAFSASLDYNVTLQKVADLMVPDLADWCTVDILNKKGEVELVAVAHRDPDKVAWARQYRDSTGKVRLDAPSGTGKVIREGTPDFYPVITEEVIRATTKDKKQLELALSLDIRSAMTVPIDSQGKTVGAITFIATGYSRHYTEKDFSMAQQLALRASLAITNASLYEQAREELVERKELQKQLKIVNEVLEHRVLERTSQLNTANVDLSRINQELQDFAYVASHDLQEPLRKIQAFGDILHEEYSDKLGDGKDYLARMQSAAARMTVLIDDLLAFSRVTTHTKDLEYIDLNVVVEGVLEDLEQRIEDTGGKVTVDDLPTVKADPTQMRQLFQNLIGNALKFHKADISPVVKISSKTISKVHVIQCSDNGVGFDEKYLDRIFAVFQRLYGRDVYEGTGIGLAVCRKIVERHNGSITAKSKPGVGSTFIIKLPVTTKKEAKL